MGEFNVNKSDGSLNPTAGMPETYPADQVMMSDGVTSVEDAVDELATDKADKSDVPNVIFYHGALTSKDDVLTFAKNMDNNTMIFVPLSNNPANRPSNNDWGSYLFIKSLNYTSILSWSFNGFACTYAIDANTQSITWKIYS